MSITQANGTQGEKEVVKLIKCPNCNKDLMLLPKNYPLCDIQCCGCNFRAQIKTANHKPCNVVRGAGWDIMEKVLKAGIMPPLLILNFKWTEKGQEHQKILRPGRREKISMIAMLLAVGLAFIHPYVALAVYIAVAAMWVMPERALDRALATQDICARGKK